LCQGLQYLLRFGLDLLYGVKSSPFQLDFHLGEEEEVIGGLNQASKGVGGWLSCFWRPKNAAQPKQCARVHCRDGAPSCFAPFAWPLPPHVLPKPPQDVTVKLCIDSLTWRHKFLIDNPVNIKKADQHWLHVAFYLLRFIRPGWRWTLPLGRLLFCFRVVPINPTFITSYDLGKEVWVILTCSLRSMQTSSRCCF
jgi:hypothetical protein